ncbi:MAG: protein kinase [Chloroflexi bacterium]|nr:protein kinase [Chloroflexota bacterium]
MMTADFAGQTIKGYELEYVIGKGGFAVVYRAYQPLVEREVAVKIFDPQFANHPNFIRRFELEAQIIAQLEHLHIVPLHDYWREPNAAFIVMRLLKGGNLSESIQKHSWGLTATARLLNQVATALAHTHRKGVVHLDLKPSNILLDEDNNAYLADFGIAKKLVGKPDAPYEEGLFGSPAYMSPEQIRGDPITPQADIYSLGVLLFEVLTRQMPFNEPSDTALMDRHLFDPLPAVNDVRADLPPLINEVIQRATAKKLEVRYGDVLSFAADFTRMVETIEGTQLDANRAKVEDDPNRLPGQTVKFGPTTELTRKTQLITPLIAPPNPYKGLRPFMETDSGSFYGREKLLQRILQKLIEEVPYQRFLAMVGASGSGKSSIVNAGLIPALHRGDLAGSENWFVTRMTPSTNPLRHLETALLSIAFGESDWISARLHQSPRGLVEVAVDIMSEGDELVLVIDQFEEVFTQADDSQEQALFLESLLVAVKDPASRVRVVIVLRADFYDRPLLYPGFGDLLRDRTEIILPLQAHDLEQVIIKPAEQVGVKVEWELVDAMINDVGQQPGALPLLQYALTELFEQREGRILTYAAYQKGGGVAGALSRRADELYEKEAIMGREAIRQLFLRLVTIGEGVEDTRRRVRWSELTAIAPAKTHPLWGVVEAFGKFRLLTFDHDPLTREPTVEVAHEALIRTWGRLHQWLDEDRQNLLIQRRLATAVTEWRSNGYEAGYLASGARLGQFELLADERLMVLTDDEKNYLTASIQARQRAKRRGQLLVAGLVLFSMVALILAGLAWTAQRQAQHAEATAVQDRNRANREARIARSRELASTALNKANQLDLALLLSLESGQAADTFESRSSLLTLLQSNPHLLTFLQGHTDRVRDVAFSPDGKLLASAGQDGRIILWDAVTHQRIREFTGMTGAVNGVAFSPDGKLLALGGTDALLYLWDVQTGELLGNPLLGHTDSIWRLAFSPDGTQLATASQDQTIIVWDVARREIIGGPLAGHSDAVYDVAFSPDGRLLASGSADGTVRLWNAATDEAIGEPLTGHTNWVWSVAFSPDGQRLVSGSADTTLIMWDVAKRRALSQISTGHTDWVRSVAFSPDGQLIVSGSADGTIRLWSAESGELIAAPLVGHQDAVWRVAFSPDGKLLVSASADKMLILWDINQQVPLLEQTFDNADSASAVVFSPDGQWVAAGNGGNSVQDNVVNLWNLQSKADSFLLEGHIGLVTSVAFSPDGQILASGSADRTVILWDMLTHKAIGGPLIGHTDVVFSMAFSPDGKLLASGSDDGTAIVWDVATHQPIGEPLIGHTDGIFGVAFSPDGRLLATASRDKTIRLWDVATHQPIGDPLVGHTAEVTTVVFSPDGQILATASRDGTIRLWDVASHQPIRQPLTGHSSWVLSLAFSPEGHWLVSGSRDTSFRWWDIETGQPLGQPFFAQQGWVNGVAFSPDGARLATAMEDGAVLLWEADLPTWQRRACQIANRNLSLEEWARYFPNNDYHLTCP